MTDETPSPVATNNEAIKKVNDLRRRILATRDHKAAGSTPPPTDIYTEDELREALIALRSNRSELVSEYKRKPATKALSDEDLSKSLGL